MNNEKEHETQQEKATGQFWQDKALPFFKSLLTDKIKRYYLIALVLQGLFLLLQFLPIMTIAVKARFNLLDGLTIKKETFSLFSFCKQDGDLFLFYLSCLLLLITSLKSTIPYFIRKTDKLTKGFFLAKLSVILLMIFFGITISAAIESAGQTILQVEKYAEIEASEIFSANFITILYPIIGIVLLLIVFHLSVLVKAQRQEDKVNARVAEELQKQKEQENIQ